MNQDFTVGSPKRLLWRFCLPLFGSVIFQQLYNIADSLIAGNFIGENALAAVGNSYEITLIFLAFAFGCNIGCSVLVSQLFGAKQYGEMKTAVSTAMIFSAGLCLTLMLFGLIGSPQLLKLIDTPSDIMADSLLYLRIYVCGLPFLFFYNISNGVFSALGDSRTPFCFLATSSISNIGVDILFVKAFNMGVAGVAWATFLCQGVSCVLALIFVFRRMHAVHTNERQQLFSAALLKRFAIIAIPSILQQSFVSVGNMFIQRLVNGMGSAVIAGYSAAVKLNSFSLTSIATIGNGISNFSAQNWGARELTRIRAGFRAGMGIVLLIAVPIASLYFFGGRYLIGLFMHSPTAMAMETGVQFLHIVSPFYLVIMIKISADGVLRGCGHMKSFMVATFMDLLLRVVIAYIMAPRYGAIGIWLAWPIGWVLATVLSFLFYRMGPWCKRVELE